MMELKFDPRNYRIHTDKNKRLIRKSLEDCGAGRSILFDKDDCIIAGNGVYEQAKELGLPVRIIESDGTELIAIKRTDLSTEDSRRKALALADNYTTDTSIFDVEAILEDFSAGELDAWEFTIGDIDLPEIEIKADSSRAGSVQDKFIIPPFSILDSRQGRWQDRKKAWIDLGIKSEVGRGEELTFARSAQPPRVYEARNSLRDKLGYDPSWDELITYCKEHDILLMDGTSIFDPVLCELAYRWFNIYDGVILDPFAGGSVRGVVASKLLMQYYGIDLRKEQIEANYKNAEDILLSDEPKPYWVCDDSMNVKELFYKDKFDLLFTCPPYADLEVYSDDPRDLSNMEYREFLVNYRTIIQRSCDLLNENRFAVIVVGEVRGKDGTYYNFVQDTIEAFKDAGLHYYNEMILVTSIGSLALRVTKQFNNSRKIGKTHQNVLVFYKGDPKRIKDNFPELDFSDDALFENE
ncbi:DNA modification methylase [Bacteroides sp. 51]|uniref:DNA modification methylase n=1 Tax=Bacteroides sp. 51 TaxID=2302938 RepID=UPI0013D79952|nr:DNA modification methylase [Bacteroides sp. 51]NDV81347.1 SAM-dependent methyltransferase [Bacteroides sp. 51]